MSDFEDVADIGNSNFSIGEHGALGSCFHNADKSEFPLDNPEFGRFAPLEPAIGNALSEILNNRHDPNGPTPPVPGFDKG